MQRRDAPAQEHRLVELNAPRLHAKEECRSRRGDARAASKAGARRGARNARASRPRRPSRMRGRRACLPAIATRGRSSGLDPQLRQPAWFATASQSPRCEWRCSRYERVAKPAAPTPAAQRLRVGPIPLCAIGRRDAPRCRSGQRRVTAWGVSSAAKASSSPRPSRSAAWAAAMRAIGTR
jgi:hypothetical protein